MKIDLVLIFSLITVIYAAEDVHRKRHEQHPIETNSSDKPAEIRRIAMPPKTIQIVVSPKPTPQPLRSLYKLYVGKKPLMRKFIPVVTQTTEQPIAITRRSLMKQRQFVIRASTIKPYQKKEDLFVTTRRRINFRPRNNTTAEDNDEINKDISEGRIVKSRIVAVSDNDKSYGDLSILPKDMMYAGSQKIYKILLPQNSNLKDRNMELESNGKIVKNGSITENNITDKVEPVQSALDNSMKIEKTLDNHQNEAKAADQDRKEFIFIIPDSTSKLGNENKVKSTEKVVENDIK